MQPHQPHQWISDHTTSTPIAGSTGSTGKSGNGAAGIEYKGRRYRIIDKVESSLTDALHVGKKFLETIGNIRGVCLDFFSQSAQKLYTKVKENAPFHTSKAEPDFKAESGVYSPSTSNSDSTDAADFEAEPGVYSSSTSNSDSTDAADFEADFDILNSPFFNSNSTDEPVSEESGFEEDTQSEVRDQSTSTAPPIVQPDLGEKGVHSEIRSQPASNSASIAKPVAEQSSPPQIPGISTVFSPYLGKTVSHGGDISEFNINPREGAVVYNNPKLLFTAAELPGGKKLNFALIKTGREEKLVPVTLAPFSKEYSTYQGSANEALLKIAQAKNRRYNSEPGLFNGSPVKYLLNHPANSMINKEEFIKFILEKDETGSPRICTLSAESTLEILNMIKEENIPINLNDKTPRGNTLLNVWLDQNNIGLAMGLAIKEPIIAEIMKIIFELDPSVIDQIKEQKNSALLETILNGTNEVADVLMDAMIKRGITFSPEEAWMIRAFKNDTNFPEKEFTELNQELKAKIFFVANAFGNEEMVIKLKSLGMNVVPVVPVGPSILAHNMDIITRRNVMEGFLKDLRTGGLLLTTEEFSALEETDSKYIRKGLNQIGRIQGRNFIEKVAEENGLKHIKVPKKMAVVSDKSISIGFSDQLELIPKQGQVTIYAERIEKDDRTLSLEEGIELMIALEKTGYNDFFGENFFIAKDGIYFIDTEYENFTPQKIKFTEINTVVTKYLNSEHTEEFTKVYKERKAAYEKQEAVAVRAAEQKEYTAAIRKPYTQLTKKYGEPENHSYDFQLSSL